MNLELYLSWKIIRNIQDGFNFYEKSQYFHTYSNPGLYNQFDKKMSNNYVPQIVKPTKQFHDKIQKCLKDNFNITLQLKSLPYVIHVPELKIDINYNFKIRFFPQNILSFTFNIEKIPTELAVDFLIDIQNLNNIKLINRITQCIVGITENCFQRKFKPLTSFKAYPAMLIITNYNSFEFMSKIERNILEFTGILIRNRNYINKNISEVITQKNKMLNIKDKSRLLLFDKQGLLFIVPHDINLAKTKRTFRKFHDLSEIGLVIKFFLENYTKFLPLNENFTDFVLYLIISLLDYSEMFFDQSLQNKHIWNIISSEFNLKQSKNYNIKDRFLTRIKKNSILFDQLKEKWWNIKNFPDIISKRKSDNQKFGFLEDKELEQIITQDYNEAKRCLIGKNFKSTIILAGSIIETIFIVLLVKLGENRNQLYHLDFSKLIKKIKLIENNRQFQDRYIKDKNIYSLLDSIRNYRNLVHPGRQVRLSMTPDKEKAEISINIIKLLIKELKTNLSSIEVS